MINKLSEARAAQTAISVQKDTFGNLTQSAENAKNRLKEIESQLDIVRQQKVIAYLLENL